MRHHDKRLMGHFEFLFGLRITCLSLNISEKFYWQHLFESPKRQKFIAFIFVNTVQYQHTLKNNIYHSNKQVPLPFFHSDTNPALGHVLVHSIDKTHALVVTAKLIWLLFLNIASFNFIPTPNKSLRFTRFRRSYVNRTVVPLTNGCQNYTAFLLDVRCSKWPCSFFWFFFNSLSSVIVHLRNLSFEHTCRSNVK